MTRYLTPARFVELYKKRWPNRSCAKSTVQRALRNHEIDAIHIEREGGKRPTYAIPVCAIELWKPRPMGRPPKA